MMNGRSCGSAEQPKPDSTSPSTPWASCCKAKSEWRRRSLPKDVPRAEEYHTAAAEQYNQYAQYALGKLYLTGREIPRDREQAWEWFSAAAEQGNEYAQFFLDHFDQVGRPDVFLAATRLLHHMGRIFQDNSIPPAAPVGHGVDRKLRQKIRAKKIAMGHKPDDHEEAKGMTMGGI